MQMLALEHTPATTHHLPSLYSEATESLHPANPGLMPTKCREDPAGELLVMGLGQGHLANIGRVDEIQFNSINGWAPLRNRVLALKKFTSYDFP